jgi:hypothetical protein
MTNIEALNLSSEAINDMRNGDMSAAMHSSASMDDDMDNIEHPSDPDAQATVTDFLDFTEYLPSDMIRSLTLIGNLDQTYIDASMNIHELTKTYGELPQLSGSNRPNPSQLRAEISQTINEAVNARTLSHAEACRMADNVDRHYNRAKTILAKLQAMAEVYPASRDASPVAQAPSSPQLVRPSKITLRLDGARSGATTHGVPRVHRHRAPRITVPGEVLAPYEFEYDTYGSESDNWDSGDEEILTPRQTPARAISGTGRIKLVNKRKGSPKIKIPKLPRAPRPPGIMGTNVHSAVAGISTSNALRECTPPPPGVVPGDKKHAPWLELTKYELAKLRKRMKKNAVWSPSDTMILRELKILGRGIEGYREAKANAEAAGEPFEYELPTPVYDSSGKKVMAEGAISIDAVSRADLNQENRGMKLNQAKKLKRETAAKELAKQAAEEAEESARKMAEAARAMKGLFARPPSKSATNGSTKVPETPGKTPTRAARKRKRESTADTDRVKVEGDNSFSTTKPKRSKMETVVPAPLASGTSHLSNISITSIPPTPDEVLIEPALVPASNTAVVVVQPSSPKKASTPILPPTKDSKKDSKKDVPKTPATTTTTRRRASKAATPTPVPEPQTTKRPASRASSRPISRGKAASLEPAPVAPTTATAAKDRSRRASTVHNTPAPEAHQARPSSRRAKRPAPGPVTAGSEGSAAVSFGKRSAPPRKKAGPKKQQKDEKDAPEIWDEIDDEGNVIDPDEPRYCLCNRVSFGVMICCENTDVSTSNTPWRAVLTWVQCEKEWFHLECVGLTEIPPRTTKWYCPDCRVKLGIGEKGEVTARGKKK